jgi:hypothetical protein
MHGYVSSIACATVDVVRARQPLAGIGIAHISKRIQRNNGGHGYGTSGRAAYTKPAGSG